MAELIVLLLIALIVGGGIVAIGKYSAYEVRKTESEESLKSNR